MDGVFDHKDHFFPSLKEMCEFYHINVRTFQSRQRMGWNLEDCLTRPVRKKGIEGPNGEFFSSQEELAKHYDVPFGSYRNHIRQGMEMKDALTRNRSVGRPAKSYVYNGKKYSSAYELCVEYGMNYSTFLARMKTYADIDIALKTPVSKRGITGPDGKQYRSVKELCDAYGANPNTVNARIRRGADISSALMPVHERKCTDHNGQDFQTVKDMCNAHGISPAAFRGRLKRGMSVEEALTTPLDNRRKSNE